METVYTITYAVGDVYRVEISAESLDEARRLFAARLEAGAGSIPEATKYEDVTHAIVSAVYEYCRPPPSSVRRSPLALRGFFRARYVPRRSLDKTFDTRGCVARSSRSSVVCLYEDYREARQRSCVR